VSAPTPDRLSKSYDGAAVVRDVSITIGEGEFVALLGPSGCGLRLLLAVSIATFASAPLFPSCYSEAPSVYLATRPGERTLRTLALTPFSTPGSASPANGGAIHTSQS
jgi:ABC-type phosphonate transport system ATPase subunit